MKIAHKVGIAAATVLFLTTSLLSLSQVSQVRDTLRLMLSYEPSERPTAAQLVEIMELLADLDRILASDEGFLLGSWKRSALIQCHGYIRI